MELNHSDAQALPVPVVVTGGCVQFHTFFPLLLVGVIDVQGISVVLFQQSSNLLDFRAYAVSLIEDSAVLPQSLHPDDRRRLGAGEEVLVSLKLFLFKKISRADGTLLATVVLGFVALDWST
jgi:hypothetical protein